MAIEDVALRREITLPVDRETAWQALKEPGWLADEVELEIEAGAEGWLRFQNGEWVHATVEEVSEQRRVVLRWSEHDGPETIVELVLDDIPEGTRLVVVELPVAQLEAVGVLLEQGLRGAAGGPRMLATVAAG
jgi:uncharacterized protein YndB with AHSA1/START domain